jgi:hypothetical protein
MARLIKQLFKLIEKQKDSKDVLTGMAIVLANFIVQTYPTDEWYQHTQDACAYIIRVVSEIARSMEQAEKAEQH